MVSLGMVLGCMPPFSTSNFHLGVWNSSVCLCGNTLELHPAEAKISPGEIVGFLFCLQFMRRVLV